MLAAFSFSVSYDVKLYMLYMKLNEIVYTNFLRRGPVGPDGAAWRLGLASQILEAGDIMESWG